MSATSPAGAPNVGGAPNPGDAAGAPPPAEPALALNRIGDAILARLETKNAQREAMLGRSRQVVQHAARAIYALHRSEAAQAEALLAEAAAVLAEMHAASAGHADLQSAGYMLDAQKEYAEARLTQALLGGAALPAPEALGVDDAAWLNGLAEAGGELRRAALDRLRHDRVAEAEALLERMQAMLGFLATVDYPSAVTRNLKQTTDMLRAVTERTRGDLTIVARQERLMRALGRLEGRLGAPD